MGGSWGQGLLWVRLGPSLASTFAFFQGYPGHQGDPGEAGLQGPKVGEKPAGEGLEMEAVGWGFPSLSPTPIHPAPTHGLARGRGTSAHAGWAQALNLASSLLSKRGTSMHPFSGVGCRGRDVWGPSPPPTRPSFAIRA